MADSPRLMTVPQLLDAVHGTCLCEFASGHGFSSVATDSRKVLPGTLFVPLMGEFQDGHEYIGKALEAGAVIVFVDTAHGTDAATSFIELGQKYRACFIMVENTLHALQDAARRYVSFFPDLIKIGITGSSGKTTTKEILGSIFSQKYRVVMNEGNLNSETGLPLSVFNIRKEHEVGIFEMGMNRRGEILEIARVLSPSLALITNVGTAHIGILGTQRAIAEEKKSIFSFFNSSCAGFVPEDDSWRDYLAQIPAGSIHFFGASSMEGFEGAESQGIDGTDIRYAGLTMRLSLPGSYNLKNALGAISLARHAGLDAKLIKAGIESVKPLFGRAEILRGKITILRDCYNANPDSMESAIDFCANLDWTGNKIFVLGSMLELGEESADAHRRVCLIAAESNAKNIFLFGKDIVDAGRSIDWKDRDIHFFEDIDELSAALAETVTVGDLVLIKGSRGMALERVCPILMETGPAGVPHG